MGHGVSSAKIYLTYAGRLKDHEILSILDRTRRIGMLTAFHAENHAVIDFLCDSSRAGLECWINADDLRSRGF